MFPIPFCFRSTFLIFITFPFLSSRTPFALHPISRQSFFLPPLPRLTLLYLHIRSTINTPFLIKPSLHSSIFLLFHQVQLFNSVHLSLPCLSLSVIHFPSFPSPSSHMLPFAFWMQRGSRLRKITAGKTQYSEEREGWRPITRYSRSIHLGCSRYSVSGRWFIPITRYYLDYLGKCWRRFMSTENYFHWTKCKSKVWM